jgi:hypothetical protein
VKEKAEIRDQRSEIRDQRAESREQRDVTLMKIREEEVVSSSFKWMYDSTDLRLLGIVR